MSADAPKWTYQFRPGGLLRCCILSLDDAMVEYAKNHDEAPPDGYVVLCRYGSKEPPTEMVKKDGWFEWKRD